MQTIVRKSDSKFCGTVPSNMTTEQEIILNVLPNFGGIIDDYEVQDIEPPILPPVIPLKTEIELLQEQTLSIQNDFDIMYAQMLMLQGVEINV